MRILVTGASGQLGAYLIDFLLDSKHEVIAWSRLPNASRNGGVFIPIDLTESELANRALEVARPDAIIHAAALSAADAVRLRPDLGRAINTDATRRIADWADRHQRRLVFTSTDLVFDGEGSNYREDQAAEPVLAYGRTKREAELAVLATSTGTVARLALLYGLSRCGRAAFFDRAIAALRLGQSQTYFRDEYRTPLDLATAARILVRLAESPMTGLFHVGGPERMSRFELMVRAATTMGIDANLVRAGHRADVDSSEPRPADVSLDSGRLVRAFPDLQRPKIEEALGGG